MATDKQLYQNGAAINPLVTVIDSLESTETEKPLSAKKGKELNDNKINKLGDVTGAPTGTKYRFPYHFETPVQGTDNISATFHTVVIDDKSNGGDYTITIPSADVAGGKAGLYTKAMADAKVNVAVNGAGELKSEIKNEGGAIKTVISKSTKECTDIEQGEGAISATVRHGEDESKAKLILNKDGAYLQKDSEIGTIKPEQALVRQDALAKKVDRTVTDAQGANNTIDNQAGQNGCVMQTQLADTNGTLVSFNTASENSADGILAQVYAKNTTGADAGKGMRLNFTKTGAYYGVGTSTPIDAAHELATKGDISSITVTGGRLVSKQWNCIDGKAIDIKKLTTYAEGDYFIVQTIAGSGTNYKPSGSQYDPDIPLREVESGTVASGDFYVYTNSVWVHKSPYTFDLAFNRIAGDPKDNIMLDRYLAPINNKADTEYVNEKVTELNERVSSISSLSRYLSTWDCTTGKPTTEPPGTDNYPYKSGDYYIISKVGTTNYKPTGIEYVHGSASTTAETETVAVNNIYKFDGTNWSLITTSAMSVTFASIAGSPMDNLALKAEFDKKQDKMTAITETEINTIAVWS